MIFWNEYDDYTIIENESLDKLAQEYNLELNDIECMGNEANTWFKYALITSRKNNFEPVYEATFIYYVTEFFAEDGLSLGFETKYFKKKLDDRILKMYFHSTRSYSTEIEQKKFFYESMVNFFKGDEIRGYEKHVFQHNIPVTDDIFEWFKRKGKRRETILSLINGQMEKPYLNANIVGVKSIIFLLNYSEEIKWKQLSPLDDRDRLRVLLN